MMTTFTQAMTAIRSRFETQWGATTAIFWQTDHKTPNNQAAFVDFVISDSQADQRSTGAPGNNKERHTGAINASVFVPLEQYPTQAETYAEQIANIFKGQTFGGVTIWRNIQMVRGEPDGEWRGISVVIPFYFDDIM